MSELDTGSEGPVPLPNLQAAVSNHRRLHWLESLRALAACYVVVHHTPIVMGANFSNVSRILSAVDYYLFSWGHIAVDVFIVLSGFALMLPVISQGKRQSDMPYNLRDGNTVAGAFAFYRSRAWRILPPYYLSMAITLVLIAGGIGVAHSDSLWDMARQLTPHGIVTHILMLHDIFASDIRQINSPFWSISVEFRIYLLFPIMVLLYNRLGTKVTTVIAVATGLFFVLIIRPFSWISEDCSPHYLGLFAGGALCCDIMYGPLGKRIGISGAIGTAFRKAAILLAPCLLVAGMLLVRRHVPVALSDTLIGLSAILTLYIVGSKEDNRLRRCLEWQPLVAIGGFSYSIYLMHYPILVLLWDRVVAPLHMSDTVSLLLMVFVAGPITVAISYIFFRLCEKPFHAIAKRQGLPLPQGGAMTVTGTVHS